MKNLQYFICCKNCGINILMGQVFVYIEFFGKYTNLAIFSDPTDKRNFTIRNRQLFLLRLIKKLVQQSNMILMLFPEFFRSKVFQRLMHMAFITEFQESWDFCFDLSKFSKLLSVHKKFFQKPIEIFHITITPRAFRRNKKHFHPKQQAKTDKTTERAGIAIGTTKFQSIINLQYDGYPQTLKTGDNKIEGYFRILFINSFYRNRQGSHIFQNSKVILSAVFLQIPGTNEIHLMDIIGILGGRNWVVSFIPRVFLFRNHGIKQVMAIEYVIDGASAWNIFETKLLEFLGYRWSSNQSIFRFLLISLFFKFSQVNYRIFHLYICLTHWCMGLSAIINQPFRSQFLITTPPLIEPNSRFTQIQANLSDRFTRNSSFHSFKTLFVNVHHQPP